MRIDAAMAEWSSFTYSHRTDGCLTDHGHRLRIVRVAVVRSLSAAGGVRLASLTLSAM